MRFAKATATAGVRSVFGVDLTVAPHQPLPRGRCPGGGHRSAAARTRRRCA
ncbi:DNA polymerase III alpha subunit [Streptomyces venezuelae]|nr:DNA polymerase III alpha subunit [Streptomyces venezuelae]